MQGTETPATPTSVRANARTLLKDARAVQRPPGDAEAAARLRWFADVDQAAKDADAAATVLKKLRETMQESCMDALDALDVDRYPLKGGPTIYRARELWAGLDFDAEDGDEQAKAEHKAAAIAALKDAGLGSVIAEQWNTQTLSAIFRDLERELEEAARAELGLGADEPVVLDLADVLPDALEGFIRLTEKVYLKAKTS